MITNSTENTFDYSNISKNSYVAFDAMSLRNLIIERLNESKAFTDQNYIGSNLAAIIDIISYTFNTLMFYLNKTSSESTFTEAQLYENINRIVKLIDYKPVGFQTSTLSFQLSANRPLLTEKYYLIPRYSHIMAGGIPFSFNEDVTFAINQSSTDSVIELSDVSNTKLLYQGIFREYPSYVAAGGENETIIVNTDTNLIDHFNLDVYVLEASSGSWYQYREVNNLFNETGTSRVFEKRLNSERFYEIQFGNNINGKQLRKGDTVAIYYLQSFGDTGVISPGILEQIDVKKNIYNTTRFSEIFEQTRQDTTSTLANANILSNLYFSNPAGSTLPKPAEDAENIRKNAPANFKGQYRLVTEQDFETYVKINFQHFINDVKVFNNWEFVSKYLRYFNNLSLNATTFQQIALNQTLYADSCNFNNIYVCAIPKISSGLSLKYLLPAQKEAMLNQLNPLKLLTTEVTFVDPIFKTLSFGFSVQGGEISLADSQFMELHVTKLSNTTRTDQSIIADIVKIFNDFFATNDRTLGSTIDFNLLNSKILDTSGVKAINTVHTITNETFNGMSFVMWNPTYPDLDKRLITNNITLDPFEFFYFDGLRSISEKIKIV